MNMHTAIIDVRDGVAKYGECCGAVWMGGGCGGGVGVVAGGGWQWLAMHWLCVVELVDGHVWVVMPVCMAIWRCQWWWFSSGGRVKSDAMYHVDDRCG